VQSTRKTRWQQATALVSLSTCGAMTGLSFAHGTVADLTSPTSLPVKLLAMHRPAAAAASDSALRSAIVKAAQHYLRLAQNRSPAAMEALIWQNDSVDGTDHGESCAAFASLTLESGAQATGQQSWVTGGTTYPWAVHAWADSRVDPNPASPGVISILQDARAHHRWHPLGDGYAPQPGDWVLFDGHVEVVTNYAGGVLHTIGGDSGPNLSVNAHRYDGQLADQGVTGFVNNGVLLSAVTRSSGGAPAQSAAADQPAQGDQSAAGGSEQGEANIPGVAMPAFSLGGTSQTGSQAQQAEAAPSAAAGAAPTPTAAIPGAPPITGNVTSYPSAAASPRYSRSQVAAATASAASSAARQAFINLLAPGALAAQRQHGIPAAVTIAQAIDESGWGQSQLATQDNNLFGIKGTGPAGSALRPTQEYHNGQMVTVNAPFRVYSDIAQSITDHSLLLATGSSYRHAMADRRSPDAFANHLTGIYATDPRYGASLIAIMRQYNLYRFDAAPGAHEVAAASRTAGHGGSGQSGAVPARRGPGGTSPDRPATGQADIPGFDAYAGTAATTSAPGAGSEQALRAGPRNVRVSTRRYEAHMPRIVLTDFVSTAKIPLLRAKPVYQDVAARSGIGWQLIAACDWMQCLAQPGHSPIYGEPLGARNPDGTRYETKTDALEQCAADLIELAAAVYGINLRQRLLLSVRDLANVFAAFRWGGLLKAHRISAMEFPYSVEGLTAQHMKMRWPDIAEEAPDKPGTRFGMPFGAVPVVLRLNYPAIG
jgi:flagellum-specific peptidoglycan hydrolase FlgJ